MNIKREILAGFTTFSAMAYVIVVNPLILAVAGMDLGAVMVVTIIISAAASIAMGLFAKLPLAIAPGMGVSAYFAFTLVSKHQLDWQVGLTACFFSGVILVILNILKLRQKILLAIPPSLIKGITAGIGLFLMVVALKQLDLISLSERHIVHFHPHLSTPIAIASISFVLIELLLHFQIRSAFLIIILLNYFVALNLDLTHYQGLVALPPSIEPTLFKLSFSHFDSPLFYKAFFAIFLVTLFDSSAGLITLGRIIYPSGVIPRIQKALTPDSAGSIVGALLGTSSLAIHIESAAGIKIGGRTGLVAVIVGLCFLASLFFYPFISSIPLFATSPILVALGIYMIRELKGIDWKDLSESVPIFIILISMPLFFSIYLGFAFGFIAHVVMKTCCKQKTHPVCWVMALLFLVQLILFP